MHKSTTILLVDEDTSFAAVYRAALEKAGFRVLSAEGVQAAQAQLAEEPVDVIVTEVLLPGRNGLRFVQDVRLDPRLQNTPVIMLTVLQAADVGLYASLRESLGITHYLVKQHSRPPELVNAVRSVVEVP